MKVGNGWIGRSLGFVLARRAPFLGIFSLIFETFFYMLFEYEDGVFPYLYSYKNLQAYIYFMNHWTVERTDLQLRNFQLTKLLFRATD